MHNRLTLLALIILICCCTYAQSDDLDNIVLKTNGNYVWPRIAVDPASGTTLIIVSSSVPGDSGQSTVSMFRLFNSRDSGWKFRPEKTIAQPASDGTIAFNSNDNTFLVVWSTSADASFRDSQIKGRLYSLKGKPIGDEITYDHFTMVNRYPVVTYNESDDKFMLLWNRSSFWYSQWMSGGVISAKLDGTGQQITPSKRMSSMIIDENGIWDQAPISGSFNPKSKRYFFLVAEDLPISSSQYAITYNLYTIGRNANLNSRKRLNLFPADPDSASWYGAVTEPSAHKKPFHFVCWSENSELKLKRFNIAGNLRQEVIPVGNSGNVWSSHLSFCPDKKIYCLVNDDQDGLVVRFLDKNGYSLDDKKRIIVRGVNHHRPFSIWNPILKKFIVVWIETVSQKSRRLRLTAVNIPAIG